MKQGPRWGYTNNGHNRTKTMATWQPRFVHPWSRSFFSTGFLTRVLHAFLFCPTRATCPVDLILLDTVIRIMLARSKDYDVHPYEIFPSLLLLLTLNCTEVSKLRTIHYEHIMNVEDWVGSLPLIDFHYWPPAVGPRWSLEAMTRACLYIFLTLQIQLWSFIWWRRAGWHISEGTFTLRGWGSGGGLEGKFSIPMSWHVKTWSGAMDRWIM
jgi:hypothetical protein